MQFKIRKFTTKSLSVFIAIILISSIAIPIFGYAKPALAQTQVPISFTFQGAFITNSISKGSNELTSGSIELTSGSVTLNGQTYQVSLPTTNSTGTNVNYVYVSSSGVIDAGAIYLGNNIFMGLAATYTVASSTTDNVQFGYGGSPYPGSTAITQGFDGTVIASISASGTLQQLEPNNPQVTIQASGYALVQSSSSGGSTGTPQLTTSLSQNALSISQGEGDTDVLTIQNSGSGTLSWTASTNVSWLTLSQTQGTVNGGSSVPVTVSIGNSLPVGTANGIITIQSNGGTTQNSLAVTVIPPTYSVTFTESGLPSGSSWQITLGSYTEENSPSSPSEITFTQIQSGTYTYSVSTIQPSSGFTVTPSSSQIQIGGNENIKVNFVATTGITASLTSNAIATNVKNNDAFCGSSGTTLTTQGETTLVLTNNGNTQTNWSVSNSNTQYSSYYSFNPSSGTIPPGSTIYVPVDISLCTPATSLSDAILVSSNGNSQSLPITIKNDNTDVGGSIQGPNLSIESQMIENTTSGDYSLQMTIQPTNEVYFMLDQSENETLINSIVSQLQQLGLYNSNSRVYVGLDTNTLYGTNANDMADAMFDCIDDGGNIVGDPEAFPASIVIIGTSVIEDIGEQLTTGQPISWSNICSTNISPSPLGIATAEINSDFNAVQSYEETNYIDPYIALVSGSQDHEIMTAYPGQEILITVQNLTPPTSSFSLSLNQPFDWTSANVYNVVTDSSSCSASSGGYTCYAANLGNFVLTMNFQPNIFSGAAPFFGQGDNYYTTTIPINDPVTPLIQTTVSDGIFSNLSFNSTTSTLSGNLVTNNTVPSFNGAPMSFTVPLSLDPMNMSNFVLTENDSPVPYAINFIPSLGYRVNTVLMNGGEIDLVLPRTPASIALQVNTINVIISGGGFESNSPINLQYWNGKSWTNFSVQPTSSTSGFFDVSTQLPIVGSANMFVKGTDSKGDIAINSITVPTIPIVNGIPSRLPNSYGWYDNPVTIDWSGFDSLAAIASCNPPTVYSGPDGKLITITGHCTDKDGNVGTGNVAINYDSTPPESYIQFNQTTKDVILYGNDSLSGIPTNPISPTSIVQAKWDDVDNKFRHDNDTGDAQIRTYDISDRAGNTLTLVEKVRSYESRPTLSGLGEPESELGLVSNEEKISILSLKYNNGTVISVLPNEEKFEWSADENGVIDEINQHVIIGQGNSQQDVDSVYSTKNNTTVIYVNNQSGQGNSQQDVDSTYSQNNGKTSHDDKNQSLYVTKITDPGLLLLHVATNQGKLLVNGY